MYEIRSYADISSTVSCLTIKQIGGKHFPKILNIYVPTLAKRILSKALNFQLFKFNYINQVSVFYINAKTKLVKVFFTLQKYFTETV